MLLLVSIFHMFWLWVAPNPAPKQPSQPPHPTIQIDPDCCPNNLQLGKEVVGAVSYYGKEFYGRKTASGEVLTEKVMSCAHRTLPFGTMLEITNRRNGKRIVAKVNDRGPFSGDRVVDITYEAARELGMLEAGVQPLVVMIVGCCNEVYISTPFTLEEAATEKQK